MPAFEADCQDETVGGCFQASSGRAELSDPLAPLRKLAGEGRIGQDDLRRALVRTLLADALGEELVGSLEFQSIAERVAGILEDSEAGRTLLAGALAELE